MKKRILGTLLCVITLCCLTSTAAWAADTPPGSAAKVGSTEYGTIEAALENWTANSTLTLLSDVTLPDTVTLKSTEHHILDLGTYTLTAASGKNAFEIVACGTGDAERSALTIRADAEEPGGIDAGSKSVVYYDYSKGGISGNDRPIIRIEGGVFTGSTSSWGTAGIYTKGSKARMCATLNISGGTFHCSINGSGKSKLLISGGTFHYSVSSQGDSTCYRLISGGTFKSFGFMTADSNNTKFWIGSAMGTSDVGCYVDDSGYLVVGGPVITEPGTAFEASSANYGGWSSYLAYSSAANGLYYTSLEEALADNNKSSGKVTVYTDTLTLPLNYQGTLLLPEDGTLTVSFAEGTVPALKIDAAQEGKAASYTESVSDGVVTRTYRTITPMASVADGSGTVYNYFSTLADALKAAKDGDTVYAYAGTHTLNDGTSRIIGKSLTLVGAGEDATVIESAKYGLVIQSADDGNAERHVDFTVQDLTIRSGSAEKTKSGHPIYAKGNTAVTLENVTLSNPNSTTAILIDSANTVGGNVCVIGKSTSVVAKNVTVDKDDEILLLANPSTEVPSGADGLSYAEFSFDAACTNIIAENCLPQEDYNLGKNNLFVNGKCLNAAVYDLVYLGLDDAVIEDAPTQHTYDTATAVPAPTKTGYTFAGWLVNGSDTAEKDLTLGARDYTDTVTLTATWTINLYAVTFESNGGSAVSGLTAEYGSTLARPADPDRRGYDFRGWFADAELTEAWDFSSDTVTADVTLYAKWTKTPAKSSPAYAVLVTTDAAEVSRSDARAGSIVTLTLKQGYDVNDIAVTDEDGNRIEVTRSDGRYCFIMPASTVTVSDAAFRFVDVPGDYWAAEEIYWAYRSGLVNGTGSNAYSPAASVTRQQVWMILARLSGEAPADMAEAREWAMAKGISDGTNPGAPVTRQQLVTLLYRYAVLMGYDVSVGGDTNILSYHDVSLLKEYAFEPFQWACGAGIVTGSSDGHLDPAGHATRAHFAVFLYRFLA